MRSGVRDLDVSLREQLRTFAETVRRDRPEFAAAVDRLITRLHQYRCVTVPNERGEHDGQQRQEKIIVTAEQRSAERADFCDGGKLVEASPSSNSVRQFP